MRGPLFAGVLLTSMAAMGQLSIRGLVQVDLRDFAGPSPESDRSNFVVRFAGTEVDALVEERFRGRILVNFSESRLALSEAWVELASLVNLRAGKFPFPITQEHLT